MKSDIEICREYKEKMKKIQELTSNLNLSEDMWEPYGKYIGKIDYTKINNDKQRKLVLVTAINPTPAGEGKTTTSIGLADSLNKLNKNAILALREPSLGPVFGTKGGACGGGYSQVVPMEDINLHFTGDFHAIGAVNNLIAACIDAHISHGNELNIDLKNIIWKRCVDMNDAALRNIIINLNSKKGIVREEGYDITVASEIMAVLCLSKNIEDLTNRIDNIIIAYNTSGNPIYVKDLGITGSCVALLLNAIKPNLVQTLNNTPAIIHGGPFANIAHGCNSIIATKTAMGLADITVTEAGFGADLGAEKFLDIKCRLNNISPDCVVLVATIRALKYNGGSKKENLNTLEYGFCNLLRHYQNITNQFNLNCVVAINKFPTDTGNEIKLLQDLCKKNNIKMALSEVFSIPNGEGGLELANLVLDELNKPKKELKYLYKIEDSIEEKINKVCKNLYKANKINFLDKAKSSIKKLEKLNLDKKPICIAKTQYSFSDDPLKLGAPDNFEITIRDVKISNGAGFIVVYTGDIMTMPGLSKEPAAKKIKVINGEIEGLF